MAARHPHPPRPFVATGAARAPLPAVEPAFEPVFEAAFEASVRRDRSRGLRTARPHGYRGAVLAALVLAGVTAVTWGASSEALSGAGRVLVWLDGHNTARGRALVSILCVAAGALAVIVAWGRETAERRPVRLAGGRARMAVDEMAATLRDVLLAEAGLADVDVRVRNLHRRGVSVTVRADIPPRARIDDTVEAVDAVVTEVVQQDLGVRLAARPAVDVRYRELDLRLAAGSGEGGERVGRGT